MPVQVVWNKLDAAESIYASKALEVVRAKTYDIKLPNLKGRMMVPVDTSVDPAAEVITYYQYTMVGMCILLSSYSRQLPRADVFLKSFSSRVYGLATSYGYGLNELRKAKMAGAPLDSKKATAARRAFEETLERLIQFGDTEFGLVGLLNQPNVPIYTVPNGVSGQSEWVNKTPTEVHNDMTNFVMSIVKLTKEVAAPDTLLLPLDQYSHIYSTPRSSQSDTTIAEFFLKNNPYIKRIMPWHPLAGAGVGGTDRMLAYRMGDEDLLQLILPQDFEQLAPEARGLELITACHGRCGGVVVYYPQEMSYGDGI